jgi:hypothetical protein
VRREGPETDERGDEAEGFGRKVGMNVIFPIPQLVEL